MTMAKKKRVTRSEVLPSVSVTVPVSRPEPKQFTKTLHVPLSPITPDGYQQDKIDMRGGRLTARQRTVLKQLVRGLDDAGATLESGKQIQYPIDAIRWLLEALDG
jgi:hypothetical protein